MLRSTSTGKVDIKFATDPGVLGSVSEERDTEWNEEIDEDGTWEVDWVEREFASSDAGG